jgi:protein GP2
MTNLTTASTFKGHPVITGNTKQFTYNKTHLDNNLKLLETSTSRHNKIYSWRMDIRLPKNKPIDNPGKTFSKLMSAFTKKLSRQGLDPAYAAKMEQTKSTTPHLHLQMLINGNKVKDHKEIIEMGEELLSQQLNLMPEESAGLIHYCDDKDNKRPKNGTIINRNSPNFQKQFDSCYKEMSYLAKQTDQDKIPPNTRKMFYSRINNRSRSTD